MELSTEQVLLQFQGITPKDTLDTGRPRDKKKFQENPGFKRTEFA